MKNRRKPSPEIMAERDCNPLHKTPAAGLSGSEGEVICKYCQKQHTTYICKSCQHTGETLMHGSLSTIQSMAEELPVDRLRDLRRLFTRVERDKFEG